MKAIVWMFHADGACWSERGYDGTMRRMNNNDTYVQLNMADGKKMIIPLSNISHIDILESEVIIE
jgi:hypothetical protein